jgi:hypothetical protein
VNVITLQLGGAVTLLLQPPPPVTALITASFLGFTAEGKDMAYTLPADMQIALQVTYVDASGNPASVDGPITWETSNAAIAAIAVSLDDSSICTVLAPGALGTAQISCTADADLGAGVRSLITTMSITVVAGEAVAGIISPVGDPVPT